MQITRRDVIRAGCGVALINSRQTAICAASPASVDVQPLCAQVRRVIEAMNHLGTPFAPNDLTRLDSACKDSPNPQIVSEIEGILDRYTLIQVVINPESRVSVARGLADPNVG